MSLVNDMLRDLEARRAAPGEWPLRDGLQAVDEAGAARRERTERLRRGLVWVGAGFVALGLYGLVATFQPDPNFGRVLAAYGGVFVAGSLLWGVVADGFRPDRYDVAGALVCLVGVAVIMYAPRSG